MSPRRFLFLLFFIPIALTLSAQPLCRIQQFDEADGVPSSHVSQLLQDQHGFMWFATWNGLCRYDGYEFQTFKSQVGDGCRMTTDRIRNITLLPTGNILCQVDEEYYMFDTSAYRFRDLTENEQNEAELQARRYLQSRSLQNREGYEWTDSHGTQWMLRRNGCLTYRDGKNGVVDYPLDVTFRTLTFALADRNGNLWVLDYSSIYKFSTDMGQAKRIETEPRGEVKCLFDDGQGRYFIATKEDKVVRVYSSSNDQLLGFLGRDGRLHHQYTSFGAAVYTMYRSADGTLWVGAKPEGLFRLKKKASGDYEVAPMNNVPHQDIYHITEDAQGRLWVATLGGGVCYTNNPMVEQPVFSIPSKYPLKEASRARYLYINKEGILLMATSSGLLVSRLREDADSMTFVLHRREPEDKKSLSCSATMDVCQDTQGRFFVSTESGGVNMIENSGRIDDDTLLFHHIRKQFHVQPNDVVQSLVPLENGGIMAVGSHLITLLDSALKGRVLDISNEENTYRFSEAHPIPLKNGRWLFGLTDGAIIMTTEQLSRQAYCPQLVLTCASVHGSDNRWAVENDDTLTLESHERRVTIHFAALDYQTPQHISYAFRLQKENQRDTTQWNYIEQSRSVTLLDLEPGTYLFEVCSTNADGEWMANQRALTIVVTPTFWESVWGRLLLILFIVIAVASVTYTFYYIRRIRREQHETLEKYLALIELTVPSALAISTTSTSSTSSELDPMLKRVMQFVEDNISNSDVNVGDMAVAAATSRSGLQRKLKQTMGMTPQDLMREARIKRACQLLRQTEKTVSEVAYACGFTDPKYFSRIFKQSTGQVPTEYRTGSIGV